MTVPTDSSTTIQLTDLSLFDLADAASRWFECPFGVYQGKLMNCGPERDGIPNWINVRNQDGQLFVTDWTGRTNQALTHILTDIALRVKEGSY